MNKSAIYTNERIKVIFWMIKANPARASVYINHQGRFMSAELNFFVP